MTTQIADQYKRLGKSGLKVSPFILGCMSYGVEGSKWQDWVLDEDKAIPIVKAAYDAGITTWDTADTYSNGGSERIIARTMAQHNIPRERVVIMTKCCFAVGDEQDHLVMGLPPKTLREKHGTQYLNRSGLSRKHIFEAVDASLKRLETDYIDLLQIHRYDAETEPEEVMEALHDVVKAGKVRYIGASSMYCYQFQNMNAIAERKGWTKFVSMQNFHNLLYREEEREMMRYCEYAGIGVIPWSPLSRGVLARPWSEKTGSTRSKSDRMFQTLHKNSEVESDQAIVTKVEQLAKKKGVSMSQIAIAWSRTKVTAPILGLSSLERLQEAIDALQVTLTDEEIKDLESAYVPRAIVGHL